MQHVVMNLFILETSYLHTLDDFFTYIIVFIPCMEISLIICLCFYLLSRRGNKHFDVKFRRIGPETKEKRIFCQFPWFFTINNLPWSTSNL